MGLRQESTALAVFRLARSRGIRRFRSMRNAGPRRFEARVGGIRGCRVGVLRQPRNLQSARRGLQAPETFCPPRVPMLSAQASSERPLEFANQQLNVVFFKCAQVDPKAAFFDIADDGSLTGP